MIMPAGSHGRSWPCSRGACGRFWRSCSATRCQRNKARRFRRSGCCRFCCTSRCSKRTPLREASRKGLLLALVGGIVTCLGNVAYYAALGRGEKVATVVSLTALYPLTTILLAVIILRERLNGVQLAGIALSFVAIWLFNIQGGGELLSRTVVYAVLPIIFWGLSGFLQKVATNHLSAEAAALVYLSAFIPVGVFFALSEPWPGALTPRTWALVLALGFFLAFGNFAILAAFARGGKARSSRRSGAFIP